MKEFHATDCFHSTNEFLGWKRLETDHYRHQLREVIIKSRVSGYGCACVRGEWDAEIQGDMRKFLGDSEGYAYTQCFVSALRWANEFTYDPEISFIFDNKPGRNQEIKAIFEGFQMHEENKAVNVPALQAADMFAWEFYQHSQEILKEGMKPPSRPELAHLTKGMYHVRAQIVRLAAIKKINEMIQNSDPTDFSFGVGYFGPLRGR